MDNVHFENIAEDFISSILQRGSLFVAKPKFDRKGADLIALLEVDDGAKFCRIQCKGRTLIKNKHSTVTILKEYVQGAFIVIIYIEIGNIEPYILCFTANEVSGSWLSKKTSRGKEIFSLTISKNKLLNPNNKHSLNKYSFSEERLNQIKEIIQKSYSKQEFDLVNLIKEQRDLIKLKDKHNELEKLIIKIENTDELLKANNNALEDLILQYKRELSNFSHEIPLTLIKRISFLIKEKHSPENIIDQIRKHIPSEISENLLKDYIIYIMIDN
jgi:hypothetical protein